jgi:hypothetical protein
MSFKFSVRINVAALEGAEEFGGVEFVALTVRSTTARENKSARA